MDFFMFICNCLFYMALIFSKAINRSTLFLFRFTIFEFTLTSLMIFEWWQFSGYWFASAFKFAQKHATNTISGALAPRFARFYTSTMHKTFNRLFFCLQWLSKKASKHYWCLFSNRSLKKSGLSWWFIVDCPQMKQICKSALQMCW